MSPKRRLGAGTTIVFSYFETCADRDNFFKVLFMVHIDITLSTLHYLQQCSYAAIMAQFLGRDP